MTGTSPADRPPARFLIEAASGPVQKALVRERVRALQGRLAAALGALAEVAGLAGDRPYDRLAVGLLRAELLFLDLRRAEALEVFEREVWPLAADLPPAHRFSLEQDRADLRLGLMHADGADDFYNQVDRRRLLGFEWLDYGDLFEARQHAARGKHHRAVPLLWQQVRRAYLHGCWSVQRAAARAFAAECVALGEWDEAVHHLLVARDDDLVSEVADGILKSRDSGVIRKVVGRALRTAHLRAHFVTACELLVRIADVIPDADVTAVSDWLYPQAAEESDVKLGPNPVRAAWEVARAVGHRLPADDARRWVDLATRHRVWTTVPAEPRRVNVERKTVVKAVVHLARALPAGEIGGVATATLPLVTERPQPHDYADVLNLLCHLADRGGEGVKSVTAAALFPPGEPITRLALQVAEHFGKDDALDGGRLGRLAERVADEIRLQVQRLKPGEAAVRPEEVLMQAFQDLPGGGKLTVFVMQFVGLAALVRHRSKLPGPAVAGVVRAALDLARDRDNFCTNRAALLYGLSDFADCVPPALRAEVVGAVEPIARGPIEESAAYPTAEQADHPLNRGRFGSGRPEEVQAAATVALASFAVPVRSYRPRLWDVLTVNLYDSRATVRQGALDAARHCPRVNAEVLVGVLVGLRDSDPTAAASAFAALTANMGWGLTRNHWRLLLAAAQLAGQSPSTNLRAHAADALRAWAGGCPPALRPDHARLMAGFAHDPSWRVRDAAAL